MVNYFIPFASTVKKFLFRDDDSGKFRKKSQSILQNLPLARKGKGLWLGYPLP